MEPLSEKRYLELHAPAGGDFLAARERLLAVLPDGCRLTLGCLQQLYPVLSAADYRVTVTLCPGPGGTDAVRVEPGDTTAEHYGLCLDIGSTTMQIARPNAMGLAVWTVRTSSPSVSSSQTNFRRMFMLSAPAYPRI